MAKTKQCSFHPIAVLYINTRHVCDCDYVQTVDEKLKFGDEKSKSAESLSRRIVRRKRVSPGSSFGTAIILEFAGQVNWLKR